jgi:hypothetical protein
LANLFRRFVIPHTSLEHASLLCTMVHHPLVQFPGIATFIIRIKGEAAKVYCSCPLPYKSSLYPLASFLVNVHSRLVIFYVRLVILHTSLAIPSLVILHPRLATHHVSLAILPTDLAFLHARLADLCTRLVILHTSLEHASLLCTRFITHLFSCLGLLPLPLGSKVKLQKFIAYALYPTQPYLPFGIIHCTSQLQAWFSGSPPPMACLVTASSYSHSCLPVAR